MKLLLLIGFVAIVSSHVYFHEDFTAPNWESRWVVSDWKKDSGEAGEWELSAGKFFTDEAQEKGLKTKQDARFYDISASFTEFSNKGKDLVVQFSVKHEQNIDCGGGYVKLLPAGLNQKEFKGGEKESQYNLMFGPDICGSGTRKVHLILNKRGSNHLVKHNIPAEADEFTHYYTAVLSSDNTYKVFVDGAEKQTGKLEDDWNILPPRKIKDPKVSKPTDWVDEKEINDPEDKKPEGWDDIPAEIADPAAKKPEDWDDELDGEWEAPKIANPDYKGAWSARKIPNPAYKGEWVHPEIDNPDFAEDPNLYAFDSFGVLGLDLWQVKAGSIFDNFLLADSLDDAKKYWDELNKRRDGEKALKEAKDKEAAEAAKKEQEAAEAAKGSEEKPAEEKDEL
eukprot:TRINITY_DN620_c0_g1_i2.p1 TRINITY_DN620_c0_g1~~TRINITY_DN620_c0_g1_i2.p1  ORF type:complete len:395 (-),score=125.76 TRINITY_DN620_c0_g1_i2:101-1285(-)